MFLIDLSVSNLWDRLENVCNYLSENYIEIRDMIPAILWISLNLELNDDDESFIDSIKIQKFADLKALLLERFDFALRENANPISYLADKK